MTRKKNITSLISFKEILGLAIGTLTAAIGLRGFLIPNHFVDGGITGVALLMKEVLTVPISATVFILNLPFIILANKHLSKEFAFRTFFGIVFLSLWLLIVKINPITSDKTLIAVFGGLLIGLGLGIAMRSGAVIDGTEILALVMRRMTSLSIGNMILLINLFIFFAAAFVFGLESAMYSVLTYFTATKTVDYVFTGIEEYTGVTIISEENVGIKKMIQEQLGRGVTVYLGKGGYRSSSHPSSNIDILYSVVTRLELLRLKTEVSKLDEKAVIIEHTVNDVRGGVIKKRNLRFD
ncbi:MAG: YitT family protein [Xanthomonadaceae bacterium]|nr:YitT family protein [Xanthomonadaceae bacterium]